jgi:hypothetical protein
VQVILDSIVPRIEAMYLDLTPTAQTPFFKLLVTFSEPINWLVNASTAAPTDDSVTPAGRQTTFSSSSIVLTNTALINISMVPGTAAVLADGSTSNAGSGFVLWFRSWSGAQAAVDVLGSAYQDLAGNRGDQDRQEAVSKALPAQTATLQIDVKLLHTSALAGL